MIIKEAVLETVCGITSKFPANLYPEVAFAGKSNVGKSSLINALMNRKSLARTSAKPGKTQTINFYKVNQSLFLVDLPGYGYTNAAVAAKEQWGQMIERYLRQSKQLKQVFLLVDSRHTPSQNDCMMYRWIVEQGYQPTVIATKSDKLKRSEIESCKKTIIETLGAVEKTRCIFFSALSKQGLEKIIERLEEILEESGSSSSCRGVDCD
ncbi:MAG: ribosome biogenesis GTP-binding protein YihA/YsxC [Clostridium sp.]|jgi:GTP-binding protein|nr:ribosome biogenesis GTP-binding protein YihA/YsxC [Clostridium sp.]